MPELLKGFLMSTTVASLLEVMEVRLSMYDRKLIKPHPDVAEATRLLVSKLSLLDPAEELEVRYSMNPFHVQYIRKKPERLLAEFTVAIDEDSSGEPAGRGL
jgi:hypothetical protein